MIRLSMILLFGKRIKAIRFFIIDKSVALWKKLLIGFATLYLISPIDLIPLMFFPVAWIDDLFLWICVVYLFKDELDSYDEYGNKKDKEDFKDKDIIEDVEFEVKQDNDNKEDVYE